MRAGLFGYAVRALPRGAFAAAGLVTVAWLWMLDRAPAAVWPAAGIAVGAVGAAASLLLDEPAASVVDTLPRPRWWRTVARLLPAALLAGAWVTGTLLVDLDDVGPADLVALYGLATILGAAALTGALRRGGRPTPGIAVGAAILLVLAVATIVNPLARWLPLFPMPGDGAWAASRLLWTCVAAVAAAVLVASCVERAHRRA
jgi:hypothetical protein